MNRKFKSRIAAGAAAVGLAASGIFLTASPAQASLGECASNRICSWHNADFSGTFYTSGASVSAYPSFHLNQASSLANKRTQVVRWFAGTAYNAAGGSTALNPGYTTANLQFTGLNDNIESHAG